MNEIKDQGLKREETLILKDNKIVYYSFKKLDQD